ncbi:hypothetical protein CSV74_11320 [Sporosarcina sp. P19]|uniref:hypothetical protein n=1 Tax=Sporosarcina sp. P19 TaxID=2048258 RepID=UPI000C165964|nr:hypothetical protein [Sporosarcina sp. P19]PIC76321.1 hypothetical protein CSV74_11320 [Sporosarcina sp. P19]
MVKKIRDEIAETYDERYEEYLDFLAEVRNYVKQYVADRTERRACLKEAIKPIYLHNTEERQMFLNELQQTFPSKQLIS